MAAVSIIALLLFVTSTLPAVSFLGDSFYVAKENTLVHDGIAAGILLWLGGMLACKRRGIAARVPALLMVGIGALGVTVAISGCLNIPKERESAHLRLQIMHNCKQAVLAMSRYAADNDDKWPATISDLAPAYVSEDFVALITSGSSGLPGFGYEPPRGPMDSPVIVLRSKAPANTVPPGDVWGYSDGSVKFVHDPR